jgi:hypothetical protein
MSISKISYSTKFSTDLNFNGQPKTHILRWSENAHSVTEGNLQNVLLENSMSSENAPFGHCTVETDVVQATVASATMTQHSDRLHAGRLRFVEIGDFSILHTFPTASYLISIGIFFPCNLSLITI